MSQVVVPKQAQILVPGQEEGGTIFDLFIAMMFYMMLLMPLMIMPLIMMLPMIQLFRSLAGALK